MVEKPLDPYLDEHVLDRSPFFVFKSQLISFFEATKKYYKALVEGTESDVSQASVV
jgi:hypothetical protein